MKKILKKSNRYKRLVKLTFIILFLLLLFFWISKFNLLSIKKVDLLTKNKIDCTDDTQLIQTAQLFGKEIFFDLNDSKDSIKKKFFCIKEVIIEKKFPNGIKLIVAGREPFAKLIYLRNKEASISAFLDNIATPSSEASVEAFLMDDEGVIFSKDNNNLDISKIFLIQSEISLFLGEKIDNNIISPVTKILAKVKSFGLNTNSSLLTNSSFIIFSDPKVAFKLDNKVDTQIASLQLILGKAKINRGTISSEERNRDIIPTDVGIDPSKMDFIDLRFDKPVIKNVSKKNG